MIQTLLLYIWKEYQDFHVFKLWENYPAKFQSVIVVQIKRNAHDCLSTLRCQTRSGQFIFENLISIIDLASCNFFIRYFKIEK